MSSNPEEIQRQAAPEQSMGFDIKQESEFIQACYNGDSDLVFKLLEDDPSLSLLSIPAKTGGKETPVQVAIGNKKYELALKLLEKLEGSIEESEFIRACWKGNLKAVSELLRQDPSLANISAKPKQRDGHNLSKSPLMLAAERGHLEIVKELLKNKADINALQQAGLYRGATALWYAARCRHWGIVEALLEEVGRDARSLDACPIGGKGWKSDYHGVTALELTVKCGKWEIARKLVDKGANKLTEEPSIFIEEQGKYKKMLTSEIWKKLRLQPSDAEADIPPQITLAFDRMALTPPSEVEIEAREQEMPGPEERGGEKTPAPSKRLIG